MEETVYVLTDGKDQSAAVTQAALHQVLDYLQRKSSSVNNGRTDQELQLLDPKKVKRILANRQSAAKSKERRQAHMSELEHELAAVQEESEALQTHRQELLGDLKVLEAYGSSLAAELLLVQKQLVHLQSTNAHMAAEINHAQQVLGLPREMPPPIAAASGPSTTAAAGSSTANDINPAAFDKAGALQSADSSVAALPALNLLPGSEHTLPPMPVTMGYAPAASPKQQWPDGAGSSGLLTASFSLESQRPRPSASFSAHTSSGDGMQPRLAPTPDSSDPGHQLPHRLLQPGIKYFSLAALFCIASAVAKWNSSTDIKMAHIATAGDPRRPNEVVKYVPNEPDEQQMPSLMLLAALGCGMIAVFAKIKYFSLAALFCIASAVAKWNSSTDIKMVLHSLAFIGAGLLGTYVMPFYQKAKLDKETVLNSLPPATSNPGAPNDIFAWLDRETDPCLDFQRMGESVQHSLELCSRKDREALPPKGNEHQQRYKLDVTSKQAAMLQAVSITGGVANSPSGPQAQAVMRQMWTDWKQVFGRRYTSAKETQAFSNFRANMVQVLRVNLDHTRPDWASGNQFSDLSFSDMLSQVLMNSTGLGPADTLPAQGSGPRPGRNLQVLPDSVDWRALGKVTSVKDQGNCGACWAYAAAAAIESAYLIARPSVSAADVDMSEQQLVSCVNVANGNWTSRGCDGGWSDEAINYSVSAPLLTEARYPNTPGAPRCRANLVRTSPAGTFVRLATGASRVPPGSELSLMQAVALQPVVVYFSVSPEFVFHAGGLYTGGGCTNLVNHAMLLVGYNVSGPQPYWIVKNSWGDTWGRDGYSLIAMAGDGPGVCGACDPSLTHHPHNPACLAAATTVIGNLQLDEDDAPALCHPPSSPAAAALYRTVRVWRRRV
ncbi:hypothetical protein QJQ45_026433 [Haematococcus lacustris]|nr:hypothetical protein QJQ45_026433 [Haematococcus lacustris]